MTMNTNLSSNSPRMQRRATTTRRRAISHPPHFQGQESHDNALNMLRNYLKGRTCYDVFPVSFRLIVLDTKLEVKKALQCFLLNGVVSAPLWNSEKSCFAGMLTVSDIIHLIQYYYHTSNFATAATDVETLRLESLRDIEKALGVNTPPLLWASPDQSLYEAASLLIQTHARRLPLLDNDTETGHEMIVSIMTQYRLLKFISINCTKEVAQLHLPLRKLGIGTYVADPKDAPEGSQPFWPLATATMSTPVFDVVHEFSGRGISAVPIIDEDGIVVNLYETVDVITLVRLGAYQSLDLTIGQALNERSPDFPGVVICTASDSLGTLLQLINKRRVHRLVVVEGEEDEKRGGRKGRLLGIITLTDVLRYIVGTAPLREQAEPSEEKLHPSFQSQEGSQQGHQQSQPEPAQSQPSESGATEEA